MKTCMSGMRIITNAGLMNCIWEGSNVKGPTSRTICLAWSTQVLAF